MIALDKPNQLFKSWTANWFTPRTTNSNLIFRERTMRFLLAVLIVLDGLALFTSLAFWGSNKIYPAAEGITGVMLIAAAVAVHRGRITVSSNLMIAAFLFFSTFLTAFYPARESFITNYILSVVALSLVTQRSAIIPSAILSSVLIGIVTFFSLDNDVALRITSNSFITLLTLSVLLYQLRAEFDNRLLSADAARRETEQALWVAQSARQDAELANQSKTRFLSTMSHELRTPLGAIIGYVGILQSNMIKDKNEALPLSNTQKDYLTSIRSNANQLLNLINGVLDLAKISSGRMQSSIAAVDLKEPTFLVGTINDLRSLAITKGIDIDLQFDAAAPSQVNCDTTQIKQVVKNLVANAIKFTEKGKVSVCISPATNNQWQLMVSDTGVGISADALAHIFDPFYQADNSDTRNYEGTGLGLAIAKSFVELHKGTIQVQSQIGQGTTFTIQLPC
jgi:signal transduction histidine kinase